LRFGGSAFDGSVCTATLSTTAAAIQTGYPIPAGVDAARFEASRFRHTGIHIALAEFEQ
jgi:hypothetical protein